MIIDVENGVPFFTPLFINKKIKKFLHIHHIHRQVWFKEKNIVVASLGWFIETKIMPLFYKNSGIITLSRSSADDIKKEKFGKIRGMVNPGINFIKYKKYEKSEKPIILFLNRIKKYKGIGTFVKTAEILKNDNYEFLVAGDGDYLSKVKHYALRHKIKNVKFLGKISEEKKLELMQKAWVFVNPSFKEGWGIVNIESNYLGTPVIGSNVGGIKDSVVDGQTGLLFEYGNSRELAQKIKKLVENTALRKKMEKNSKIWAGKFNWDKKAEEYLNILKKATGER